MPAAGFLGGRQKAGSRSESRTHKKWKAGSRSESRTHKKWEAGSHTQNNEIYQAEMKFIKWLRPAPPADPTAAPPAQERSESLRIADEDEAMVRAAASSGVHFSSSHSRKSIV